MKIAIIAVGRLKDGPERELYERYRLRLDALGRKHALGPLTLTEIPESRQASAEARRDEEAKKLLAAAPVGSHLVLLDERGKTPTSAAFAADLRLRRDAGTAAVTYLLGGADGHGAPARAAAHATLALGSITLPHGLARVVLVEQLYRAATLIAGHPYHRA
jgi:23S rRNA (pseudouridine1915-N3)-methyltransferase